TMVRRLDSHTPQSRPDVSTDACGWRPDFLREIWHAPAVAVVCRWHRFLTRSSESEFEPGPEQSPELARKHRHWWFARRGRSAFGDWENSDQRGPHTHRPAAGGLGRALQSQLDDSVHP